MSTTRAVGPAALNRLLRAQWLRLRDWIDANDLATSEAPSALDGWSVADLVAHLGLALGALAHARPAPPDAVPVSLAAYVSGYPDSAEGIAEHTRDVARQTRDAPLAAIDRSVDEALTRFDELHRPGEDPVVLARRGAVLLSTLVLTRLLEYVVHGDDLARSVPGAAGDPLEPDAVAVVAAALRDALAKRGGPHVEIVDDVTWLRLACGRVPADPAALQASVRPAAALAGQTTLLPLL